MRSQTEFDPEAHMRRFLDDVVPSALFGVRGEVPRAKAWRAALYDAGLACFEYPDLESSGHALPKDAISRWQQISLGRTPPEESVFAIGVGMALPTIRELGSAEQRHRFLAPGLRGEEIWCQLFSEPGAGSDLPSLQTRAVLDGDEWVLHGQKVWSSGAHHSDLAIVLARTSPGSVGRDGLSMLILPMDQSGVDVRPLRQMTGATEFNEVFLDGARAPGSWILGDHGGGWAAARALLAHERVATGTTSVRAGGQERRKSGRNPLPHSQLAELAVARGRAKDPLVRQELAQVYSGERIMQLLAERPVPPSIGKLWRTKQGRRAADLAARLAFPAGPGWASEDADADYWNHHILNCRAMSIGGGTDEIQRNTLAERHLGLPREPRRH